MADAVTDTHALIWYLEDIQRLGPATKALFDDCANGSATIHIPTICLVEILYLQEKGRIPTQLRADLVALIRAGTTGLTLCDLSAGVVEAIASIPRSDVPDMPDRIIAGTALYLGLPLISRDARIRLSAVPTIW